MVDSNPIFITVRPTPPLHHVGWQIRVVSLGDMQPIAWINGFRELMVGPELNAPGAGSITFDADDPFWSTTLPGGDPALSLIDSEHLWQCWEDGVLRFAFLGTNVTEGVVEPDETRTVTVSGPGAAATLKWAKVLMPGNVAPDNLIWRFTTPLMQAWLSLLEAAQNRGTITFVNPSFTAAADSAGTPWADAGATAEFTPDLGADLLTVLDVVAGQDLTKPASLRVEWFMWPGFELDVRPTIGTHRETQVIFFEGGLLQTERSRVRDEIANVIQVRDIYGAVSPAIDSASVARWGRREALDQKGNITDATRRDQIAQVMLAQHKDENSSWTIRVPYSAAGRRVFRDFDIGDWIGIGRYNPTGPSTVEAYRVLAITVRVPDTAEAELELTLQSKQDARQRDLERQLTTIINQIGSGVLPGVDLPEFPTDITPIGFDPSTGKFGFLTGWSGGGGGGGGDGCHVYIQATEPEEAVTGDFWFDTSYDVT